MKLTSVLPKFINELEFSSQDSFTAYKKRHPQMRPTTKVKIAGKETTVGDASKKDSNIFSKIGSKLFGKSKVEMPKLKPDHPLNVMKVYDTKSKKQVSIKKIMDEPDNYQHLAADVQSMIDLDPTGEKGWDGTEKSPHYKTGVEKTKMAAARKAAQIHMNEQLEERHMTDAEMAKREDIVKGMKKGIQGFKARYGDRAKNVMYATATKQAMKEEQEDHWQKGYDHVREPISDEPYLDNARHRFNELKKNNPHKKGTKEHDDWHAGAHTAYEEHKDMLKGN